MANNTRDPRAPRNTTERAATSQHDSWIEPSSLPDPDPQDGFVFRWIRTATLGQVDPTNVSTRFREGWFPAPKEDFEHLGLMRDQRSRFPDNLEVGGLLLCKMEESKAEARKRHYEDKTSKQIQASDNNFMRASDPRMPILSPERKSTTTFGTGRPTK